jgi:hypothetical protein
MHLIIDELPLSIFLPKVANLRKDKIIINLKFYDINPLDKLAKRFGLYFLRMQESIEYSFITAFIFQHKSGTWILIDFLRFCHPLYYLITTKPMVP